MDDLSDQLARWRRAGLLTADQAAAIVAFESGDAAVPPADARPADARPADAVRPAAAGSTSRRTRLAEAVGYVGAGLAIGALALLLQDLWDALTAGSQLGLIVLLTVLLAGAGTALHRTDPASPPLQRLASVLLTGAVLGTGWAVGHLGESLLRWRGLDTATAMAVVTTAVAVPLHRLRPRALPQLTALATVLALTGVLLARPALAPEPIWYGLVFWALGLAWLLLGAGGYLRPRGTAEAAGGVVALLALQAASFDDARLGLLSLALATAGALVAAAIATERGTFLVVGAIGLFVLVPQLVVEIFGDTVGAPATLLTIGLLLVLLAVGLGRARRELRPTAPEDTP